MSVKSDLNSQNRGSSGLRLTWLLEYLFPRLLPSQTSTPASASIKPRLSLARFSTQHDEQDRRPCCISIAGLPVSIYMYTHVFTLTIPFLQIYDIAKQSQIYRLMKKILSLGTKFSDILLITIILKMLTFDRIYSLNPVNDCLP